MPQCVNCHRIVPPAPLPIGAMCKHPDFIQCEFKTGRQTDYLLRGGQKIPVQLFRKPCRYLGERTEMTTKTNCKTPTYAPVYRCETFRLASPFGQSVDAELIHPCEACKQYEAQQ